MYLKGVNTHTAFLIRCLLALGGEAALGLLLDLLGGGDVLGDAGLHLLQHGHGLLVDGDAVLDLLVNEGDIGDEVEAALALLLLQLQGDATDGAAGQALHQVGGVAGDLVLQLLGLAHADVHDDTLVDVVVKAELAEVLLDDLAGGALDGLGTDLTHAVLN